MMVHYASVLAFTPDEPDAEKCLSALFLDSSPVEAWGDVDLAVKQVYEQTTFRPLTK